MRNYLRELQSWKRERLNALLEPPEEPFKSTKDELRYLREARAGLSDEVMDMLEYICMQGMLRDYESGEWRRIYR